MRAALRLGRWYGLSTTCPRMLARGGSGKGDVAVFDAGRSAATSVGCSPIVGAPGPVQESETFEVEAELGVRELGPRG